jgi:hypothetical protein
MGPSAAKDPAAPAQGPAASLRVAGGSGVLRHSSTRKPIFIVTW